MNKLVIVASTLGRDGTSRFITYLANNLTKQSNIKVKLLFFRSVSEESIRLLDKDVDVECLNIEKNLIRSSHKAIGRILAIRPTYCLFGFHQLLWIGFLRPLFHLYGIKIFIRDTIIPTLFHARESRWRKYLNRMAYHCYDKIITQSIDMLDDLVNNWGCDKSKLILINNPVDIDAIKATVGDCPDELRKKDMFTFVAAGRLAEQKGYDIIINRMSEMKPFPTFKLLVLGSGELEEALKILAKEKGVDGYIHFIGYRTNVSSYIYHSDALLLSSRYEGFPNIVLEAQALGKPVFANTCLGGINEIIINGENGIACNFEDPQVFQNGLSAFFNVSFSAEHIKMMTENRYGMDFIMPKYINLFK